MDFSSINFLAVIVAAVAAFGLGALWYGPIFGEAWQKELGFTDEYLKSGNMGLIFGSSFAVMFAMAIGLSLLLSGDVAEKVSWREGVQLGLLIGVIFAGGSMAINYLYQRKSIRLWAIDALYQILFLAIMGAIIGGWR